MNMRDTDISHRVNEWLDRFSVPAHLKDKATAAQQEAEAILRMFLRYCPRDEYVPFLNRVFDQIDYQKKTRYWPTPQEVGAVCVNILKDNPKPGTSIDRDMSTEAIMARRMERGDPVGEGFLYGRAAVDLIATGLVSRETMEAYRKGAFWNRAGIYGQEQAREWEAEAILRHEKAKAVHQANKLNPARKFGAAIQPRRMDAAE